MQSGSRGGVVSFINEFAGEFMNRRYQIKPLAA